MCVLAFAYKVHPKYPLIFISNRDEFYQRATRKAQFWEAERFPGILAGKDLEAGGTWLGLQEKGRWGALTNYRAIQNIKEDAPSRGHLVLDFLKTEISAIDYLSNLQKTASLFNGFNLLLSDEQGIYHYSNVTHLITIIQPGIHVLSNALLNTPWPKTKKIKALFIEALQQNKIASEDLFSILNNKEKAAEDLLPKTGLSPELEKEVSSIFIETPNYGTRCSTLLLQDNDKNIYFTERSYSETHSKEVDLQFEIKL
ncbi:MAG TPA: NRDE family protein [Edaphocola sp.]|nr:NRDE family protein [Edaphocola sp.]